MSVSRVFPARPAAFLVALGFVFCVSLVCVAVFGSSCAWGAEGEGAARWTVTAVSAPTNFRAGDESGDDAYKVIVENTGSVASTGPITVTDVLPAGLSLDSAGVVAFA